MTEAATPVVTRDPRFLAGRKLVERGLADEAVDVYATLVEETRLQYGDTSIEAAPAYYEYGNSLLRAVTKQRMVAEEAAGETGPGDKNNNNNNNTETTRGEQRAAAAAAAERRQHQSASDQPGASEEQKPAAIVVAPPAGQTGGDDNNSKADETPENDGEALDENDEGNSSDDGSDDLGLALEMMENSFSILEEYKDTKSGKEEGTDNNNNNNNNYSEWVGEQLPRILLGIGDTLSRLDRHADAADAFSRALEWRKASLEGFADREGGTDPKQLTLGHLKAHRMVCEASVLIAEELLACPPGRDVATTETRSLIVEASERVSYARGYYDQARDALQEAVVFMGSLPRGFRAWVA